MTLLSFKLSRALSNGRARRPAPDRASLLVMLLRKRATAHNVGADDLEGMLRDQIRWSLPVQVGSAPGDQAAHSGERDGADKLAVNGG